MATKAQEEAVRKYLLALRDPTALRDEGEVASLERKLKEADDELERLQIRQQLLDLEHPPIDKYEAEFVTHAKAWADERGISGEAFIAESVPAQVLRRAGFRGLPGGRRAAAAARSRGRRRRVSADEVRAAIPSGTFTIQRLQQLSGASPAVVRRIVQEELEASRLTEEGKDPDHRGPGRAPALYRR